MSRTLRKADVKMLNSTFEPEAACTRTNTGPSPKTGFGKGRPITTPVMAGVGVNVGAIVRLNVGVMVTVRVCVGVRVFVKGYVGL